MNELIEIYGCFPDIRCLAALMSAGEPRALNFDDVMSAFLAFTLASVLIGFLAVNCGGGRK